MLKCLGQSSLRLASVIQSDAWHHFLFADSSLKFEVCWWMRLVAADYWPSYKTVLVESNQDVMVSTDNSHSLSVSHSVSVIQRGR